MANTKAKNDNRFELLGSMPEELTPEELALDTVITSLGEQEGCCLVKRKRRGETVFAYVGTYRPASAVTLEELKKNYGGGEFRLDFRKDDGTKHKALSVTVAEEFKGEAEATPDGKQPDIASIIKELRHGDNQTLPMMMAMMQASSQQNAQMMQAMMQSQAQMIAAMIGRPLPVPPPMPEILLTKLLEQNKPIDTFAMIRECKALLGNGEEKEPEGLGERLLNMAPALLSTLAGGAGAGKPVVPSTGSPVVSDGHGSPRPPRPPANPHTGQLNPDLKKLLVNAALKNSDVGLYADFVEDQIGEPETMTMLVSFLKQPEGLQSLIGDVPPSTLPWFEELSRELQTWTPPEQIPNEDVSKAAA